MSAAMLDFLNGMYDAKDDAVQLLYKYRSCEPRNVDCLRNNTLWFSTQAQLNDPYDCVVRLPDSIGKTDIEELRAHLASATPYELNMSEFGQIAEHIGKSENLPPLVPLGLMAAQLRQQQLVKHIRKLRPEDDAWVHKLFQMAREMALRLLSNMTVFCLSEENTNQLLWAHYAAAHTGFCTGYVCPVGILNPQLIHKVEYETSPRKITPWQLIDDPGSVYRDLMLVKPSQWSYESEWRLTFGNMPGLISDLLPYRMIILGARISRGDEQRIRAAAKAAGVSTIFRAVLDQSNGSFDINIEPAESRSTQRSTGTRAKRTPTKR
jgi:hypothetical protein